MARWNNEKEVLQFLAQIRRDHAPMRAEVAARTALGLAYAHGRQWTSVGSGSFGQLWVDTWDEDWDPKSAEIRVVDNRIGPLVRRIAANTNATRIEASVTPPSHLRTFEASDQASVSQLILNALALDVGMTRIARYASSLRWKAGSSLIHVTLNRKKRTIPQDVARHPDGSPVEINDKWVRWEALPLSDLIWDPTLLSSDLEDHSTLILESILPLKRFQQLFGAPEDFGFDTADLPTLGELAPHHISAASLTGTAFYQMYARSSEHKGIRVINFMEADPHDPTKWPILFQILDIATDLASADRVSGKIINWDNPESEFGHHQRPLFKLDAFRREDAVLAHGAPHVMMSDQDRLNILRSIQFQQLTAVVHGMWLLDKRTADPDSFASDLATGVGGILRWDSRGEDLTPPQFVHPPQPRQEFVQMGSEINQNMMGQVHITQSNLGIGKTHIPQQIQARLLQESTTVVDNIILQDVDTYSDALQLTIGTVRLVSDGPNRMLARLRDKHGFTSDDLQVFLKTKPRNSPLLVRVRQHAIISRSIDERTQQLMAAVQVQAITPQELAIAFADELERPILKTHELQIEFSEKAIRQIIAGAEWPGMPHLDLPIFLYVAEKAMWGLDLLKPKERAAIKRLQEAILVQKQLSLETSMDQFQGQPQQQQQAQQPSLNTGNVGGAPESINPVTSPVGAAGGLPLGLPGASA